MQRRTNAVSGSVDFPMASPLFRDTREGGLVVKLVVCDDRGPDEQFGVCCGAQVYDVATESLVGDDQRAAPSSAPCAGASVVAEQALWSKWKEFHIPRHADASAQGIERDLTRDYLAVLVLGTTGWSGWRVDDTGYWQCAFEDLTEQGQALYNLVAAQYPGCKLHLLTFLDT